MQKDVSQGRRISKGETKKFLCSGITGFLVNFKVKENGHLYN